MSIRENKDNTEYKLGLYLGILCMSFFGIGITFIELYRYLIPIQINIFSNIFIMLCSCLISYYSFKQFTKYLNQCFFEHGLIRRNQKEMFWNEHEGKYKKNEWKI